MTYDIAFHPEAKKELDALDGRVRIVILKQLNKLMSNPHLGEELGHKAGLNLTGFRKLYADNKRIRILYKIISEEILVYVISIGKRDKMEVYKKSIKRL
jgi:mRNA interferase RelE/StbE